MMGERTGNAAIIVNKGVKITYGFSRSVWTEDESKGTEERDDLLVRVIRTETPDALDTHLL